MINNENITYIITCFKSEKLIDKTLLNLPATSKKIVIENSGNIELKRVLEKKYKNLNCFVMKKNLGYGAGNNFGIERLTTRYFFIISPDTFLKLNQIKNIINISSKLDFTIIGFMSDTEKINMSNHLKFKLVKEVKGFAMLFDNKNLNNLKFDENFFLYLEEIDLCKRVINNNGKIYLLNMILEHLGGKSHGEYNFEIEKSRNWHWMWSKFYFKKKHDGYFFALLHYLPTLVILYLKYFSYLKKNKKKEIIEYRLKGLFSSIIGKKAFYRPIV